LSTLKSVNALKRQWGLEKKKKHTWGERSLDFLIHWGPPTVEVFRSHGGGCEKMNRKGGISRGKIDARKQEATV